MGVPATTGRLCQRFGEMKIGDYIKCEYDSNGALSAYSGSLGRFLNVGENVQTKIEYPYIMPHSGNSTSINYGDYGRGLFYLIKANENLYIADRKIGGCSYKSLKNAGRLGNRFNKINNYNIRVRALKNNEFDKYIVKGTLNSTAKAADNNVWHCSEGRDDICKWMVFSELVDDFYNSGKYANWNLTRLYVSGDDINPANSTLFNMAQPTANNFPPRIMETSYFAVAYRDSMGQLISNASHPGVPSNWNFQGFRPVFELSCELYKKENKIYGMGDKMFTKLSDNWSVLTDEEKQALFESTNYDTASVADLATLGKFKLLNYAETNDKPEFAVYAAPKDKLVTPREFMRIEDIEGIDKATLTKTLSGNGICKLLVTDDMKTYYAYDFDTKTWKVVDHTTFATVKTSGIDVTKFADIDRVAWDKLLKGKSGVGFAYLMALETVADQCMVDKLALQVDKKGKWENL